MASIKSRGELWEDFDARVERVASGPAYIIEETTEGLWWIMGFVRPTKRYGQLHRLINDPPKVPGALHEGYYEGVPAKNPQRFSTRDSAEKYLKWHAGVISFDEYRDLPSPPWSGARHYYDAKANAAGSLKPTPWDAPDEAV